MDYIHLSIQMHTQITSLHELLHLSWASIFRGALIYISTFLYSYLHISMSIYIFYLSVQMHTYIHTYTTSLQSLRSSTCPGPQSSLVRLYICLHIYVYLSIYVYLCVYIYVISISLDTYIHTYIHTYITSSRPTQSSTCQGPPQLLRCTCFLSLSIYLSISMCPCLSILQIYRYIDTYMLLLRLYRSRGIQPIMGPNLLWCAHISFYTHTHIHTHTHTYIYIYIYRYRYIYRYIYIYIYI